MIIFKRLKYLYLKKHRYLEPLIQDMIATKTGFIPYEITYYKADKQDKAKDFNYFTFLYKGTTYKLKDDKLEIISEDDI